jgi:hypothetical protein
LAEAGKRCLACRFSAGPISGSGISTTNSSLMTRQLFGSTPSLGLRCGGGRAGSSVDCAPGSQPRADNNGPPHLSTLAFDQAPQAVHPAIHRDALKALAEREGVHPLFLYPELRFRSRERDQETDRGRLASIRESVLSTISSAENELGGLQARLERARQSAAILTITGKDEELGENDRAGGEVRVLAPERRIEQLKVHLAGLRRIESAVNKELNS